MKRSKSAEPSLLEYALAGRGAHRHQATAAAFIRVGALLRIGRIGDALSLLDYAARQAHSDGGIGVAIAVLRLTLGDPRAVVPLEALVERTDCSDIRLLLVRVRMRFGQADRAAIDLHATLSRNGAPHKRADIALADAVSERVGAPGWCALDNAGRVTIGAPRGLPKDIAILLDGEEIPGAGPRRRLPRNWQRAHRLDVLRRGRPLLGSPVDVARVTRVEGFVEAIPESGGLRGWCWFPGERHRAATVTIAALADPRQSRSVRASIADPGIVCGDQFGFPLGFSVDGDAVEALGPAVAVTGPHGQVLYGSPLWPSSARETACAAVSAAAHRFPLAMRASDAMIGWPPREIPALVAAATPPRLIKRGPAPPMPVDIVIAVHTGFEMTMTCIESVRAQLAADERIIVVVDGSPDRRLIAALTELAARGGIVLQVEAINRGFPATANIGIRLAAGHDVVLLNSDTVVTPNWLAGLRAAVRTAPDIGTATPLSNDATIFSYPRCGVANPFPDAAAAASLAATAALVNGGTVVDMPTGHGFCMYIRSECLQETGILREDCFGQGYGEENDFCMRARHLGWRHVAVPGVFVAHRGGASFHGARDDLMRRNIGTLNRLHIGYDALIALCQLQDPLAESRRRIDLARHRQACAGRESVLLITHDRAGGGRRHVDDRATEIAASGRAVVVLRPDNAKDSAGRIIAHAVSLDTGVQGGYPNLRYSVPTDVAALKSCLRGCAISEIEVHSLIGHDGCLVDLVLDQNIPFDVVLHDYSWFCPRITLTAGAHRYCGEPAISGCRDCVAAHGTNLGEVMSPDDLVARSARLMTSARMVLAPSDDTATRIRNRFGAAVTVRGWEPARRLRLRTIDDGAGRSRALRVCVVGAIGFEKGYNILLSCARSAAERGLPLEFVVVGETRDDARLLDTGVVRITGRYDEAEAVALISAQNADVGWLPSAWPETWSYVLTRIWEAGLFAVVHDIGAPAERVRATGGGLVLPLHLPAERLAECFLDARFLQPCLETPPRRKRRAAANGGAYPDFVAVGKTKRLAHRS